MSSRMRVPTELPEGFGEHAGRDGHAIGIDPTRSTSVSGDARTVLVPLVPLTLAAPVEHVNDGASRARNTWAQDSPRTKNPAGDFKSPAGFYFASQVRSRATKAGPLLLSDPGLRASEQRHADIPAHHEFLSAVVEMHLALVDLAVLGIEDLAAFPSVAIGSHAVDDRHAFHWLILAGIGAGGAAAVRIVVVAETGEDLAGERAVG